LHSFPTRRSSDLTGTKAATTEAPKVDVNKIYDDVEQSAAFPGGINSFRNRFVSYFDGFVIEGEGSVKTEVMFVVERDGSLTVIKANGPNRDMNGEAINKVNSINNKCTHAI